MTQMEKKHNSAQKHHRPGQRQRERLQRLARRRRRRQIILSIVVTCIIIIFAAIIFWQYQAYTTRQHNLEIVAATKATATASARAAEASPTAFAQAVLTATSGSPTPAAGPASPPAVNATPTKLADGLQYIDIKVGSGAIAQKGSSLQVEYTGWLASSGKKFDSSYDRQGQPFTVSPLGQAQVIAGWNEGLLGVRAGGMRRLIIPDALAYGAQGYPPTIPANATLIFDVTVISVQ